MTVQPEPGRLVSDRLISVCGAGILGLIALSFALYFLQPCTGDLICAPAFAVLVLGPPALVYLGALLIWIAARRVSPLLVLTVALGLLSMGTLTYGYVADEARPLSGIAFLAPVVVIGAIEVLRRTRIERWLSIALLVALAGLGVLSGAPWAAALAGLPAAWLVLEMVRERSARDVIRD